MLMTEVDKIWDRFDSNDDGVLDQDEVFNFIREMVRGQIDPNQLKNHELLSIFKQFDLDRNGYIEKSEMLAFLKVVIGI